MKTVDNTWVVVSFKAPLIWQRDSDETWLLNPRVRYVIQSKHLRWVESHIETLSELSTCREYRPFLDGRIDLSGKKILIERSRDCGIGDLLFMTGPMSYLHHVNGGRCEIDIYGLNEKGQILDEHPALHYKTALRGPLSYDTFRYYDYHWLLPSVTEYSEEPDQLNVYDAIYTSIGIDPTEVDPIWKRPSVVYTQADKEKLDAFFFAMFNRTTVDFRRTGYYVVSPHCYSSLRTADYMLWLSVIERMAKKRPVLIIGENGPSTNNSMSFGEFVSEAIKIKNVCSLIGETTVRILLGVIKYAATVVTLDSAPLYIAQSFRTPAISLWGTHNPSSRIRHDSEYLRNAIWNQSCQSSPCYLYRGFSEAKCPAGLRQGICENLRSITPDQIMERVAEIERSRG